MGVWYGFPTSSYVRTSTKVVGLIYTVIPKPPEHIMQLIALLALIHVLAGHPLTYSSGGGRQLFVDTRNCNTYHCPC